MLLNICKFYKLYIYFLRNLTKKNIYKMNKSTHIFNYSKLTESFKGKDSFPKLSLAKIKIL